MDELLTPGKGRFRIKFVSTVDKEGKQRRAKNGDRKVLIIVEATDSKGAKADIFENITLKGAFKIENICKAAKMGHLYISSDNCLDGLDDLQGAMGDCVIGHQDAQNGYPACNKITKYTVSKADPVKAKMNAPIESYEGLDQDIPF